MLKYLMRSDKDTSFSFYMLLVGVCAYIFFIPIMQNPFRPILPELSFIRTNSLQFSDLILLLISPFGIYQFILNWKTILKNKYILYLMIGNCLYLLSIFLGINNYMDLYNYFEFLSACSLVALFYFIIILCISDIGRKYLLISSLFSFICVIISCLVAIILFLFLK